jgi:hypothetical protein
VAPAAVAEHGKKLADGVALSVIDAHLGKGREGRRGRVNEIPGMKSRWRERRTRRGRANGA